MDQMYIIQVPADDIANLTPGSFHLVESHMPVTKQHRCFIVPRSNTGMPSCPSIRFAALGAPGPTIGEIRHGRMQLEHPDDHVLAFRTTRTFKVDWPGVKPGPVTLYWDIYHGRPRTRESLAKEIARIIYDTSIANPHIKVHWEDIRLLAISYYRGIWVPILSSDSRL